MTKKHFTLIANNLRTYVKPHMSAAAYNEAVARIAFDLALENPRFDQARFAVACA